MPTARELLEQADALMRRNRSRPDEGEARPSSEIGAASGEPAIRGVAEGLPGSGGHEPAEVALPSQVAAVSEAPPIAGMVAIRGVAPFADDSALPDIPELTDVVAEPAFGEEAALASPVVAAGTAIAPRTDAAALVAEIDAASEPAAIVAEGEPSVWLDEASLGDASITGPAPDSVLVVEPAMPETAAEVFADRPIPEAVADMFVDKTNPEPPHGVFADESTSPASVDVLFGKPIAVAAGRTDSATGESPQALAELPPLTLVFDEIVTPANDATMPRATEPPTPLVDESPGVAEATEAMSSGNTTERFPTTRDDDAARWEALAEEIRMQVLQRIDIFTDTGLKAQLDERLKPVVDRASAELVGTVSQHVGQLLRAYVAEAIEREIDKWRHGGG